MPKRIQLRRTKGWRKPEGAVVVARPSRWGNPYHLRGQRLVTGPDGAEHFCAPGEARGVAVRLFREDLFSGRLPFTVADIEELRGRDLACWCPLDEPCHADLLLIRANWTDTERDFAPPRDPDREPADTSSSGRHNA